MEPFAYHVYVCNQQKPDGAPCCGARGAERVIDALRRETAAAGLAHEVQITACGSLGLCDRGPNMVVYPEGTWYVGITADDIPEIVRQHFGEHQPVARLMAGDRDALRGEIDSNRARYLAAAKMKEASGTPPDEWVNAIRAFMESRVILSAIELDIFTAVGDGATAAAVASRLRTAPCATETFLNAVTSLGLLSKQGDVFRNTPTSARYFAAGGVNDSRMALMHTVGLWTRWSTMTECVRAGTSVSYREVTDREAVWTRAFIAAMHSNAALRAPQVVKMVGAENVRRLLDLGGGSGAYTIAFAQANPELRADLFDLSDVLPIAGGHIAEAGLSGRITLRPGDMRKDDFGTGYDLVLLSAICHMYSPEENRILLEKVFRAVVPGGRVVIQDFILDPDKTSPRQAALFALNMLVGTPAGGTYSEAEYAEWMRSVGFADIHRLNLPGPASLMVGIRRK
jgi:(2Fe-2S) ferredoxin/SAM-dependent methyltransferase